VRSHGVCCRDPELRAPGTLISTSPTEGRAWGSPVPYPELGPAAIGRRKLVQHLPRQLTEKLGLESDAQRAIQFARSAPGMLSALVGMSNAAHVKENIRTASVPPMPEQEWLRLFNGYK